MGLNSLGMALKCWTAPTLDSCPPSHPSFENCQMDRIPLLPETGDGWTECPKLSEPDSRDIREAAVTPRPASELSGLGKETSLPGSLADRRYSNTGTVCLGEPGLPSLGNGEPEERPLKFPSASRKSWSELKGTFGWVKPSVLISQMEKLRPREAEGLVQANVR